ncbi:hypothetical protein NQ314_018004 [Rhamnusium bicolor]|uniref:Origin recognition complex subunit 3 n=1 Tax=Rhamnusium bicolor TaxID=1586634 RepID=A0AAV8WRW2_9CUCU|nr:hypothetical protein NQ314_018004 [Rhamnusium bicolor]
MDEEQTVSVSKELNNDMFSSVLGDLINFIKNSHDTTVDEIPTAALLTGINMPDHGAQFRALSKQIKQTVSSHVACLYSQDCQNIKYLMENMIYQFINEEEFPSDDYAMAEHFSSGNAMSLCNSNKNEVKQILNGFTHEDCENVRQIMSFRKLVESESYANRIKLLTDDAYFKKILEQEISKINKYIKRLHIFLKCLFIMVEDLPKAPLGKQIRELYSIATSENITKTTEYKECFQLLGFQSKEELCLKLSKIVNYMSKLINDNVKQNKMKDVVDELSRYLDKMNNFDLDEIEEAVNEIENEDNVITGQMDRKQLKEKLLEMTKNQSKPMNKYEKLRKNVIQFLSETFEHYLIEPSSFYFHEIFFFNNISIQNYIIGTHRSAIHNALNDPQYYLQCNCCEIPNGAAITRCMPDICVAYKLHLECGKLINLYDWLQAFLSIVDPVDIDDDTKRTVDPELQARFTQAVAELEYLGFIKSSKRKADHVTRLTWGG